MRRATGLGRIGAMIVLAAVAACHSKPDAESARLERITLAPHEVRRAIGEMQHFTATGHYAGGSTRNLTQRVRYASSDPAIARAPNEKGNRSRIEAIGAGTVAISATDPATGVSSHGSGDDASFTVLGALESLTLAPTNVRRVVGQTQTLTATGHYAGGTTRNLTQHVVYSSSDETVAVVRNADGDKSRVEAVGVGTATISAVDPKTRIGSAGAAVTITVTP